MSQRVARPLVHRHVHLAPLGDIEGKAGSIGRELRIAPARRRRAQERRLSVTIHPHDRPLAASGWSRCVCKRAVGGGNGELRATRPVYCALSNEKLRSVGIDMPTWQDGLRRYLQPGGDEIPD